MNDRSIAAGFKVLVGLTVVGLNIADFANDGEVSEVLLLALLGVGGYISGERLGSAVERRIDQATQDRERDA